MWRGQKHQTSEHTHQQAHCEPTTPPSETHSIWRRALAGCQEQIIYWLLHGNTLNSSLNCKVFPALSEQYQSTSHMHISKQIFPSTFKDSREPDGKTTEQHVTNMGCEVGQTWAWIQVALLPCKLLHFPELHMSRVILSPSEAFSFHGVITFCRELNPHDL